jgi:hypothetical protein
MERAYNCPNRASRIFFKNAVVFNRLGHYGLKGESHDILPAITSGEWRE